MARVTIEDCAKHIPNRFMLVQAAVRRARQLIEGSRPLVQTKNREAVVALREIAAAKVRPTYEVPGRALAATPQHEGDDDVALLEAAIEEVSVTEMAPALSDLLDEAEESAEEAEADELEPQEIDAQKD